MRGGVGSTSDGEPGRPGAPVWLGALAAVLVVASAATSSTMLRDRADDVAAARAQAQAARTALDLRAGLTESLMAVDTAVSGTALETVDLPADGPVVPGSDPVLSSPEATTAMARARDTGSMVVSAPVSDAGEVLLVRARFAVPDPELESVPRNVAQRRAGLTGYTVGIVDVEQLLPPDEVGSRRITDGDAVLVGFDDAVDEVAESDVSVLDRLWVVAAPVERASSVAGAVVAGLGVLACLGIALATWWWWRRDRARSDEAARVRERADAVVTYAGVVQDSHDLGQVVPAIAVQVADRLGLAGVSLGVTTDSGRNRDVFTHGEPPDPSVTPMPSLPLTVAAGETVALHLRRAERSIGILRFRCGRDLGPGDVDQLRIAAELVTSSVVTSRALEQQQDAVERLQVLDELKNTFLGTASHELRTPVTAIAGFSFMLSERWDVLSEQDRRTFAERISSNARALEALVQDLLDFARMERGDLQLVLEPLDLGVLADRVIDRLEPVWSSHTIERDIDRGAVVVADVAALERIVTNLVSNAVKFSPRGSTIRVTVDRAEPEAQLVVDDRGPGVPPEDRERIFVRFFRGRGEAVLRTGGVGIGLAVVKDFVDQMGGAIAVGDSPEGGARFTVRLPLHRPAVEQEVEGAAST